MDYTNTIQVLNEYAEMFIQLYRQKLNEEGINASNNLYNSITSNIEVDGSSFEVQISLEDYWYYVEAGRKAGKFPPVDSIRNWITAKKIIPQPYILPNGSQRIQNESQLSFLIGRKISQQGIIGKHIFSLTNEEVYKQFYNKIQEALAVDIGEEVASIITLLK